MPWRPTLSSFLATARSALTTHVPNKPSPLTIVIGNESADLDSLCSAILYAYLRTTSSEKRNDGLHVPLCHIPRDDLSLRPEFAAVLRKAGTSPDEVITLSELPSPSLLKPEDTRWILVDHNAMTGQLAKLYSRQVVGCIDHHADEEVIAQSARPRVIGKTGSCMTLVVRECRAAWDALPSYELSSSDSRSEAQDAEMEDQLAHLALAPVLVDTHLLLDASKTKEADLEVASWLEGKTAKGARGVYARKEYHDLLDGLKRDLGSLSVRDILRKDYKEWDEAGLKLGTSSVTQDFDFLLTAKAGGDAQRLVEQMSKWAEERGIDVVAVLTTSTTEDGVFERGFLLWARGDSAVGAAKRFERDYGEELGMRSWGAGVLDADGEADWRRCWKQGEVKYSRKQVAPMLREAMKGK